MIMVWKTKVRIIYGIGMVSSPILNAAAYSKHDRDSARTGFAIGIFSAPAWPLVWQWTIPYLIKNKNSKE